jgi:hypothetical protein
MFATHYLVAKGNRNAKEKLPAVMEYKANMNLWIDVTEDSLDTSIDAHYINARTEKRLVYSKYDVCRCGEVAS